MPKIFARIPFWVWPIMGIACIIMSVPGFIAWSESSSRAEALQGEMPELADLGSFDPANDVGAFGEVHLFAQTNPEFNFTIDSTGITTSQRHMVPLFAAEADVAERNVGTVLLVEDIKQFNVWLSENVAGNARIGDLYAINGRIVDGRGFTAAIKVTLRDAGLNQAENITIIEPFIYGREAALGEKSVARFGNPIILLVGGLYLIAVGLLIWKKSHKVRQEVSSRLSALSPTLISETEDETLPENVESIKEVKAAKGLKPRAKSLKKTIESDDNAVIDVELDATSGKPRISASK